MNGTETENGAEPGQPHKSAMPPLLKLALDMGPLVIFFLTYRAADLMTATAAVMVATIVSLSVSFVLEKRLAPMPLVTGFFMVTFGGLTLVLQNDTFIKMKPTIVNLIFASVLAAGMATGRPLMKFLFQEAFKLTDEGWRKLTVRWMLFFLFLAGLNEVVWRTMSEEFWVAFKVWGNLPITVLFTLSQIPLLKRYHPNAGAQAQPEAEAPK